MISMTENQQTLVQENVRLAYYMANKWWPSLKNFYHVEDLRSLCLFALCKAALHYDEGKGTKFATFASTCMDNEVLMQLRKDKRRKEKNISLEHILHRDFEGNNLTLIEVLDTEDNNNQWLEKSSLMQLFESLTDREKTIMIGIYFKGYTQKDIGKSLRVSQSYVARIKDKALIKMKKYAERDNVPWF